jgi:hypothetical protein
MEPQKIRATVTVLAADTLPAEKWKRWAKNLLTFTAPALVIFFGQLAAGVDWRAASAIAVLAFYGAIADLLKKYKGETIVR